MKFECHEEHIGIMYGSQPCPLCASHDRITVLEGQMNKLRSLIGEHADEGERECIGRYGHDCDKCSTNLVDCWTLMAREVLTETEE